MEQELALFSAKIDKVMVLVRILRDYNVTPPTLNKSIISKLIRHNLENTLVALSRANSDEQINTLLDRVDSVRKEELSREEKRAIIDMAFADSSKIKQRYFKGYPK